MSQRSIDELPAGKPKVDSLVAFADPATGIAYKINIKEFLTTGADEGGSTRAPVFMNSQVPTRADLPQTGLPGELRIVKNTKEIFGWDDISQSWISGGSIAGPAGETLKISSAVGSADLLDPRPPLLTTVLVTSTKDLYIFSPTDPAASPGPASPYVPPVIDPTNPTGPPLQPAQPAKPPIGWVQLGKIEGPPGQPGPKGDPGLDKGTVEGQILRWSVVADKWAPGGAPVINPAGLADGNIVRWNATLNRYDSVPLPRTIPDGLNDGDIVTWDITALAWVPTDNMLFGQTNIRDIGNPDSDGGTLVFDQTAQEWDVRRLVMADLDDVDVTTPPAAGDVLQWSDNDQRWEPAPVVNPDLNELGNVFSGDPTDKQILIYNQTATQWEPKTPTLTSLDDVDPTVPTDKQILIYNQTATKWEPKTPALATLDDVDPTVPTDGQFMIFDIATKKWIPKSTSVYTKLEVDTKLETLVLGLEHGQAVISLTNNPPIAPVADTFYIVGKIPTGAWAGQPNNITWWDGAKWVFQAPGPKQTHMVEDLQETWSWNGTAWNKVAVALTGGAGAVGDLLMVGDIKQSVLTEPQFKSLLDATEQLKWVLADGRDVTGSKYAQLTSKNTVPDLRGAFLRMAGQNAGNTSWNGGTLNAWQEDSTARPKTAFTTDSSGNHSHSFQRNAGVFSGDTRYGDATFSPINAAGGGSAVNNGINGAGNHAHTVTGGGDIETRPKNYGINFFIKVN